MPRQRKNEPRMSRRQFLKVSAVATAGAAFLANGLPIAAGPAKQGGYSEAPELAELVASGGLPPVADRLPVSPVVIEPLDSIGEYGGMIRTGMFQDRTFQIRSAFGPEPILRFGWDASTIEPNIAESWEYSNDGKTFTLHLREGMKWSDGAPFDATNFDFWYNHIFEQPNLGGTGRDQFVVGGQFPAFEVIDNTTVSFTWDQPHANLPGLLAHWVGANLPRWLPRHYLEQFHPDFADAADLEAKMAEAEADSWEVLITNMTSNGYGMPTQHVEMPTLLPYKLAQPYENNLWLLDRNPYYWKVDTEGNQLPYINGILVTNFENPEIRDAAIAAGEMNWVNTDTTLTNFPLYQQNAEAGNYEVRLWRTSRVAEHTIMLNHTSQNEALREIFNDIRFKRALSLAMDRQTIANVIFQGFGVPAQIQMIPGSKFRVEEWVTQDTEYDPDTANALLDEMGLTERSSDGTRLMSNGDPLMFRIDVTVGDPGSQEVSELCQEFWREVGVKLDVRVIARDLIRGLIDNNEIEAGIWIADKCSDAMFPHSPEWHVPYAQSGWNMWGIEWTKWYATGGAEGQEPTGDVLAVQNLFDEMTVTPDEEERIRIGKEILRLNIENLWNIGDVGEVPIPVILGDNFKNYPAEGFTSYDWLGNHMYHIEQTYFEGGDWTGAPS